MFDFNSKATYIQFLLTTTSRDMGLLFFLDIYNHRKFTDQHVSRIVSLVVKQLPRIPCFLVFVIYNLFMNAGKV